MVFHSMTFLVLFLFCLMGLKLCPRRLHVWLLLLASWVFYGWFQPWYILLLIGSTTIDYTAARVMWGTSKEWHRRLLLTISLSMNVALLLIFRGYSKIHPIGISFYTLQAMGYTIDVYRRRFAPEKNFGRFALFIAFFPMLMAGPIEHADVLIPQFTNGVEFKRENMIRGIKSFILGLFKKIVIADNLAPFVDLLFNHPTEFASRFQILAIFAFNLQVYFDFSGYAEMGWGLARLMGFDVSTSFQRPHWAPTASEFWQRWNSTIYRWFLENIYIPIGGNTRSGLRNQISRSGTWIVSGLWHGFAPTFLLWGLCNSALSQLPFGRRLRPLPPSLSLCLSWLRNVSLFSLPLILFRSPTLGSSFEMARHILSGSSNGSKDLELNSVLINPIGISYFTSALFLGLALQAAEGRSELQQRPFAPDARISYVTVVQYSVLLNLIYLLGKFGGLPFVYYKF